MVDAIQASLNLSSNRLLSALDVNDFALLAPHLRDVPLMQGKVLQEQEAPVEYVYFPLSGVISLISVMENGDMVQTAMVGRDGAVGAFGGFGPWNAFSRAVVQLPGMAAVVPVARFQAAVAQSDRIRSLVLRFKEALLAQVQQTAACNALHPLEARLARWLLQTSDLADVLQLPLKQDFIAQMLAVRRTTVTLIASKLQQDGLIGYRRGRMVVLDRSRLEETACECYGTMRGRADVVLGHLEHRAAIMRADAPLMRLVQ
jgi:CRP-like cAMP-binding protein